MADRAAVSPGVPLTGQPPVKGRSLWAVTWSRFKRRKVAVAGLVFILLVYTAGLFAPWVAPYDYRTQNLDQARQPPSWAHLLGTDELGRDILSRLIWGARTAAVVSVLAVSLSTIYGVILGALAGYLGGWVDALIMRIGDILFAFPGMLFVIFIAATVKPGFVAFVEQHEAAFGLQGLARSGYLDYVVVFGALSFVGWPGMARLVRGQVLSLKNREFVVAAQALGASTWQVVWRHLLPNALPPVLVAVSMGLGHAVTAEVVLSWLGIGVQPPNPSWGTMIWENRMQWRINPHLLLMPAATVGLVNLSFQFIGDALNDALNPRGR
jgi:ABC-type dipeptide/oligopeptide/nickel transport system permease subunit